MKKYVIYFIIFILLLFGFYKIRDLDKTPEDLTTVNVAEVTHSIFYSPWYVALENGYFEDEGLNINVVLTPGADKVMAAVLSKDVNIGFSGPEATIYVKDGGEKDYVINFAALTKRDGQFILGPCSQKDNFKVKNLKGKKILVGRSGGMPAMTFLYALKQQGINTKDVKVDTSVEFAALSGAFIGGSADYVNLFEPTAYKLEKEKYGCVLSSVGLLAGEVPYTVFNTRLSYYNDNPAIIKSFTKALNKGLKYVKKHSSKEIAQVIKDQFPDNSIEELTLIVERYKNADSWWDNTYIEKSAFDRLEDLMKYNGVLKNGNNYNSLVKNDYNE